MESELCRCCLGTDRLQCMAECCVEYNKSYVEMLNECFNINICECRPWICIICIAKLTDAYNFHSQVCKSEQYLNPTTETIRIFKTEVDVKHDPGSTEEDVHREEDNHDSLDTDMEMDNLPLSRYRKLGKDEFLNEIVEQNSINVYETNTETNSSKAGKNVHSKKKINKNNTSKSEKSEYIEKLSSNNVGEKKFCTTKMEKSKTYGIVDNVSKISEEKSVLLDNSPQRLNKVESVVKPSLKSSVFAHFKEKYVSKSQKYTARDLKGKNNAQPGSSPTTPLVGETKSWTEHMTDELGSLERDCMDYYLFSRLASKYICAVCKESYADIDEFKTHTRQHSHKETEKLLGRAKIWKLKVDISSMKCRHCNEPVIELDAFQSHLSFAHGIVSKDLFCRMTPFNLNREEVKCVTCKQVFINILNLTKHMNTHSTNCICSFCGITFIDLVKLKGHIKRSHTPGTFKCIQCDEIFETIAKRDYHTQLKHGKRWNLCPHCPEKLPSFRAKMIHLAKVHNEELNKYKCPKCPKKFVTSGVLSSHNRKVHLQERNHVCAECDNAFFQKKDLVRHMIKHSQEKNYGCQVCGKAYARASTLREHMRIHNNDRKHICQICGRGFVQKCALKGHLHVHAKDE